MNTSTDTAAPTVTSVRRTAPGEWLVVFTDGLRYPMAGGFRDEADVLESAIAGRAKAQELRPGCYTVARADADFAGCWATLPARYDSRDRAEVLAQALTRETGVEHASFFGEAESYYEPADYIEH